MGGAAPAHWKPLKQLMIENKSHMDFMPVPKGSWSEYNAQVNAKYNKNILIGLAVNVVLYGYVSIVTLHFSRYYCYVICIY